MNTSKLANIDEYIAVQTKDVQPILIKIRETIRTAAPNVVEKISYQMPIFGQDGNFIYFAAFKKHIGIYPGALEHLPTDILERITGYKTSKGAIQFPLNKPIDYELIADITKWRVGSQTDLTKIPGIGKKMAQHLIKVGYHDIESLKGQDPEEIYTKHCLLYGAGNQSCRCVLYCYRLAVHYADNDGQLPPDKQNWEDWKD